MKKLLVLPLIAITLSACLPGKKSSASNDLTSDTDSSSGGPTYAGEVAKGKEHSLPWNVSYDTFSEDLGNLSYDAFHKTYDIEGTNLYAYGMRAVTDISMNVNGSLVAYGGFKIIHFCKTNHEKWPDGGQIQISDIKPTKMILELVSNAKYSYSYNNAPTLYAGNRKIETPANAIKTVSPIHEEFNVFTVTYEINSTVAEVIKIKNEQTFSMYLQSIQFE